MGGCDVASCPGSYPPWDGGFAGYFGPVGNTATISQLVSTKPKKKYTLSFYLADPVGGSPSYFKATVGTSPQKSYVLVNPPAFGWTKITITYTAKTAITPVSFTFQHDPAYWFLDEVAFSPGAPPGEDDGMTLMRGGVPPRLRVSLGQLKDVQVGEEHSLTMNVSVGNTPVSGAIVTFTSVLGDLHLVGEEPEEVRQRLVRVDRDGHATIRYVVEQPGLAILEVSCAGQTLRLPITATNVRGRPQTKKAAAHE